MTKTLLNEVIHNPYTISLYFKYRNNEGRLYELFKNSHFYNNYNVLREKKKPYKIFKWCYEYLFIGKVQIHQKHHQSGFLHSSQWVMREL